MNILITGANGFIGKNLRFAIEESDCHTSISVTKETTLDELRDRLKTADIIIHLAGINRPKDNQEFQEGNVDFTATICSALLEFNQTTPIIFASSIQAELDNPYGVSKKNAELKLIEFSHQSKSQIYIFRLPNVFGKWCKPNYNSAVATFCHNIARDLPIQINDKDAPVNLVYIDDVISAFFNIIDQQPISNSTPDPYQSIKPIYKTTVGAIADTIESFKTSRENLITERVGTDLTRALHSTYLSYLDPSNFSYTVPKYGDERGVFVEMLKTQDSGQMSFFTAHPGITRGNHYHHTKTEKFLVIKGKAHFGFRNILTGETYEKVTDGDSPEIVETVPGWTHNITNIGENEMIVMLWANEIFDREHPDTYAATV